MHRTLGLIPSAEKKINENLKHFLGSHFIPFVQRSCGYDHEAAVEKCNVYIIADDRFVLYCFRLFQDRMNTRKTQRIQNDKFNYWPLQP